MSKKNSLNMWGKRQQILSHQEINTNRNSNKKTKENNNEINVVNNSLYQANNNTKQLEDKLS